MLLTKLSLSFSPFDNNFRKSWKLANWLLWFCTLSFVFKIIYFSTILSDQFPFNRQHGIYTTQINMEQTCRLRENSRKFSVNVALHQLRLKYIGDIFLWQPIEQGFWNPDSIRHEICYFFSLFPFVCMHFVFRLCLHRLHNAFSDNLIRKTKLLKKHMSRPHIHFIPFTNQSL